MVESSLLSATLPCALAGEYSQEYFRPGPDGNDRCAKQLTIIESDGRDGYSMAKALTVVGYIRFACDENPTGPHLSSYFHEILHSIVVFRLRPRLPSLRLHFFKSDLYTGAQSHVFIYTRNLNTV